MRKSKYKKDNIVNYLPKLSGFSPKKKLTINSVKWQESDELSKLMGVKSKPTWVYGFKGSNLSAVEDDIKLSESNQHLTENIVNDVYNGLVSIPGFKVLGMDQQGEMVKQVTKMFKKYGIK